MFAATLLSGYLSTIALDMIGLKRRRLLAHAWVLVLTPLYWFLLSLAAWRALFQLLYDPQRWEKTEHGLARTSHLSTRVIGITDVTTLLTWQQQTDGVIMLGDAFDGRGKRTLLYVATVVGAVFMLVTAASAQSPVPADSRLKSIIAKKVIRIAYRADARPFSFLNDAKEPLGYTIDLCQQVAKSIRSSSDCRS